MARISIALTILSLIITLLAYYGVVRYCKLRYDPNCTLQTAENYLKLQRVNSPSKVVVSLYIESSVDDNITLKSILDQTVHPDQIILVSDKPLTIPSFLKDKLIVTTQTAGGLGCIGAMLSPLNTQKDSTTKIIVVKDGVVYGPDFIESIVEKSNSDPNAVIYIKGNALYEYIPTTRVDQVVINTDYGVLITPGMFRERLSLTPTNTPKAAPNAVLTTLIVANKTPTAHLSYTEIFQTSKQPIKSSEIAAFNQFAQWYNF